MKKEKWNLENIKEGLEKFYEMHKRYPTAEEVDEFLYLPSARQIQRRFGGLVEIRKILKLTGPSDFTKGKYSSDRARRINERAHRLEKDIYNYLVSEFGIEFVHREYFFTDDRRTRTDFFIFYEGGNFSVDVFYPKTRHSLIGCINSKLRTYNNNSIMQYPVIFLMMNDSIGRGDIDTFLNRKKNKLFEYQRVMTIDEFKDFCKSKDAIKKFSRNKPTQ